MEAKTHRPTWKTLLAFAIIYFVWGSTFFAIRVGIHEVPPLVFAAMRFLVALLIFVIDYGLMFWAEQRVPSGVAAVMMATIPVFIALSEIFFCVLAATICRHPVQRYPATSGIPDAQLSRHPLHSHLAA
jgi:drug/metabolite transporter (DMT)-like permease